MEIDRRTFLRQGAAGLAGLCLSGLGGCGEGERVADTLAIGIDRDVATVDPAMHRCRTVQAVVLLYATSYALLNLAADVLYTWVNPRIEK